MMDRHIIYYSVNKKMPLKALQEKLNKKTGGNSRVTKNITAVKPLNINISLTTPKFSLKILIKSLPVSSDQFLVSSSCLLVTR